MDPSFVPIQETQPARNREACFSFLLDAAVPSRVADPQRCHDFVRAGISLRQQTPTLLSSDVVGDARSAV